MKLKTIAALFSRNKRLNIHTDDNGEQWIGNGIAAYSLRGMPHMTPDTVLRIFDVPADKQHKWITDESEMPTAVSFKDKVRKETEIEPLKINIGYRGVKYWLFPDEQRIYSFREDYIKPLLDEPDYLTYHKRETEGGGFVLACKIGGELKAIIAPAYLHITEEFTEEIAEIASLYAVMSTLDVGNVAYEIFKTDTEDTAPPEADAETREVLDGQMKLEEHEE
jgi:hypothetical protein